MRLDRSDAGWTSKENAKKLTKSVENLDKLSPNGFINSQLKGDLVLDELFLPVYKHDPEINETHFSVMHKKRLVMEGAVQQSKDEATIQDAVGYHPLVVKPFWFFSELIQCLYSHGVHSTRRALCSLEKFRKFQRICCSHLCRGTRNSPSEETDEDEDVPVVLR